VKRLLASCRFFKPLVPLWGRQIPYTMMKFAAFENIVNALYVYVIPKPKSQCNKTEQLGVSFVAGYIAGVRTSVSWASFSILLEPAELHDS
jgi:solute carrier family 25 (mitochondrial phosphate transporter), member 3